MSNSAGLLILASRSAARCTMLTAAGLNFQAVAADIDESALLAQLDGAPVGEAARQLATAKAMAISARHPGARVIGADSIVETDAGVRLEKPGSITGLVDQLQLLRGRRHRIISAVAVVENGVCRWQHDAGATLEMRAFSDQFLADYVTRCGEQVMHSVGGYHVEGEGVQLFRQIDGDHFTIRGLPLLALLAHLRDSGGLAA